MRYLIAIVGALLLLGGLGAIKGAQVASIVAFADEQERRGPPPEAVAVWTAEEVAWERSIDTVGSVASERSVTISAEAPGRVERIAFASGAVVDEGEVLVELDTRVERAELRSTRAAERLAAADAARVRPLARAGVATAQELDEAEAALRTARAEAAALRARIARKIVRAPFAGRLGIRTVDLGQYIEPGTPITVLETTDTLFVDFTLPQQRLDDIAEGTVVRLRVSGADALEGSIDAVEPAVDPSTRAMRIRARVPADGERGSRLRTGMFVDVEVVLPQRDRFVTVPLTAIVHAPYGDSVFVVEDKPPDAPGMRRTDDGHEVRVARQQFVRTGPRRGDFVAVLEGVRAGQEVVSAGAFKLRNGAPVFVGDATAPEPSFTPRPENR